MYTHAHIHLSPFASQKLLGCESCYADSIHVPTHSNTNEWHLKNWRKIVPVAWIMHAYSLLSSKCMSIHLSGRFVCALHSLGASDPPLWNGDGLKTDWKRTRRQRESKADAEKEQEGEGIWWNHKKTEQSLTPHTHAHTHNHKCRKTDTDASS